MKFASAEYLECKKWISSAIEAGHTWEEVKTFFVSNEEAHEVFTKLQTIDLIIPLNMEFEDWAELVSEMEQDYQPLYIPTGLTDGHFNNSFAVPTDNSTPWIRYKRYLAGELDGKRRMSDFSIGVIEKNCHWVLNHLNQDTRATGPVKGLVMGSVQSGKTANMIGLSTMAAYYDWNIFILLSGTIENLRKQTRDRFSQDLRKSGGVSWHILDKTSTSDRLVDIDTGTLYLPDDLKLNNMQDGQPHGQWLHRYVIVCLKNKSRLERLINWLHADAKKAARMRIIVIDDEADQASINTKRIGDKPSEEDIERTAVNQLIVDLVNGKNADGSIAQTQFQAMNYVSFTATPYANVLNEASDASLYPKNFICNLPEPKEYFGPKVIFGSYEESEKYPGLSIIRTIPSNEMAMLRDVHNGTASSVPDEMKKSVAWFLSSAALLRKQGHKKPISMLIHTTGLQNGHLSEYELLRDWLQTASRSGALLDLCESVYSDEIKKFTYDDLKEGFPDYTNLDSVDKSLPAFSLIKDEVVKVTKDVVNILLDEEGELVYNEDAIHLCVDNCKANWYADDGAFLRLVYPTHEQLEALQRAPVFIVMGGNTLSRGLTIEGLVCSYFARNSNLADTLMQMARWFGYKTGYELLQRIWMTQDVEDKFHLMEQIDEKLKREFDMFMERGISPSKFGPRIMNSAAIVKFLLTSKNKSQNLVECDFDFCGDSYEITKYDDDHEKLMANLSCTEAFLNTLGIAEPSDVSKSAFVWRNVPFNVIKTSFLAQYSISPHSLQKDIPIFVEWMDKVIKEENRFQKWNVAVAGDSKSSERWQISGANVGKIARTKKISQQKCIDIGSLRSGTDVLCDVNYFALSQEQKAVCDDALKTKKSLIQKRNSLNLGDYPLLLLYRIEKNGGVATATRERINSSEDIIGFSIIVPGESDNISHAKSVTVKLPE